MKVNWMKVAKPQGMKSLGLGFSELKDFIETYHIDCRVNEHGQTLLMIAVKHEPTECVRYLIEQGASIDQTDYFGMTALMHAAERGKHGAADLLIRSGANVNAKDNDGETALMMAAGAGQEDIVELLVKKGATINAKSKFDGSTALMNAAARCNLKVMDFLVRHGAFRGAKDFCGNTVRDIVHWVFDYDECQAICAALA